MEQEFEIVIVLSKVPNLNEKVQDALFLSGCDDATISMRHGQVYLTFARYATSLRKAILSAIDNVQDAKIGGEIVRVEGGIVKDINNDGYPDIITGAYARNGGLGAGQGVLSIILGQASGFSSQSSAAANYTIGGEAAGDNFGWPVQ
jgi:hypothetical protein